MSLAEVFSNFVRLIFVLYRRIRGARKTKTILKGDETEGMKNGLRRGSMGTRYVHVNDDFNASSRD